MVARRDGWWGVAFVLGVVIAAGVVSLPASSSTPARIAAFYQQHTVAVIVTQLVGLAAAVAFVMFLRTVLAGARSRMVQATGGLVVLAQLLTAAPVLALAVIQSAEPVTFTRLTQLSELADDVLFVAIALFCAELALTATQLWLRILAGVVAALALARGVEASLGGGLLDAVAPSAFLLLVLVISVHFLLQRQVSQTAGT